MTESLFWEEHDNTFVFFLSTLYPFQKLMARSFKLLSLETKNSKLISICEEITNTSRRDRMLVFIKEWRDENVVQGPVSQGFKSLHQKQHELFLLKHCQN